MTRILCMLFGASFLLLQFFTAPEGDHTALILSNIWIAAGAVVGAKS